MSISTTDYLMNSTHFNATSTTGQANITVNDVKHTVQDWFLCAAFFIIMCTGVLGNFLVIYVFGYVRRRKTKTTELLIIYLASIDLLTSVFNPPLYIYWTLNSTWHFGQIGCSILPVIGPIMTTASGLLLLVFAVERYVAIVLPFYGKFSSRTVTILFWVTVVISILMYIHYIKALTYDGTICYIPNAQSAGYGYPNCAFIIVRLLAFLIIFSFTNLQIFLTFRRHHRHMSVRGLQVQRSQQSQRIMRIVLVMGVVFIILVFPRELLYLVYNMSHIVDPKKGIKFTKAVIYANSWLKVSHTANSCANVFIYAHMQTLYRRQIMKFVHYITCTVYNDPHVTYVDRAYINSHSRYNNNNEKKFQNRGNNSTYSYIRDTPNYYPKVFFKRAQMRKLNNGDAYYDPIYV